MELAKEITFICDEIKRLFDVEKIIVFSIKRCEKNNCVTDLDVCVVSSVVPEDRNAWLKKAYLEIDSEIPFDLFLYTPEDWESLTQDDSSFASRIARKGCVVFEKKENS